MEFFYFYTKMLNIIKLSIKINTCPKWVKLCSPIGFKAEY